MLPPTTRLGYVHLNVNDLDRQIAFYTNVLGFVLHWRREHEAALGTADEVLLRLSQDSAARRHTRATGIYHFAILYPSRKELARAIARVFALRWPNAPTDHGESQTTYLDDAEGNNIELYVRTPEAARFEVVNGEWIVRYADGRIGSGRDPLDLDDLFGELNEEDRLDTGLPIGTRIGHVHLYASSLANSQTFYADVMGFKPGMQSDYMRMYDLGLDTDQPHVIAFNTWRGENIPPAPEGALGLRLYSVVLPNAETLAEARQRLQAAGYTLTGTDDGTLVRDPSHIALLLTLTMPPTRL